MAHEIIGRKRELEQLNSIFNSNKAELVAVYGASLFSLMSCLGSMCLQENSLRRSNGFGTVGEPRKTI